MKFLHLADLHLGKRVNEFSMLENQRHILLQVISLAKEQKVDAVLLAGDIYDKSIPSAEAVELLDSFLTSITALKIQVFLISGNHDSPERLDFGSRIMQKNGIHIASVFRGHPEKYTLYDEYGPVNIYSLPFIKPAFMVPYFQQRPESYHQTVALVLEKIELNLRERNVLLAHQFVIAGANLPKCCDSETVSVGGLDQVDASLFDGFDYVALGHLHGQQRIGRDTVRYAGSPLKYSFSETYHKKGALLIDIESKGKLEIAQLPLTPLYDLREIRGPIAALTSPEFFLQGNTDDYIHAILTDEAELYDPIGRLRAVYPNIMRLDFENRRTVENKNSKTAASGNVAQKTSMELFREFYQNQNNLPLSEKQEMIMKEIFEEMEETTDETGTVDG